MKSDLIRAQLHLMESHQLIEGIADAPEVSREELRRAIIACLNAVDLLNGLLRKS